MGNPTMRFVTLLALLFLMSGCATAEMKHQITPEDTAWIQKGTTTRTEVEARFGSPNFEVPEYAGSTHDTTSATTPRSDKDSPATKTTVDVQPPKDSKATYVHPESSSNVQTQEDRFWVTFDANNLVKDFGFAGPPAARRSPAAANVPE
ncbi:MAG TPA: hypothetical protein VF732_02865 [Nitrospira sp.]